MDLKAILKEKEPNLVKLQYISEIIDLRKAQGELSDDALVRLWDLLYDKDEGTLKITRDIYKEKVCQN